MYCEFGNARSRYFGWSGLKAGQSYYRESESAVPMTDFRRNERGRPRDAGEPVIVIARLLYGKHLSGNGDTAATRPIVIPVHPHGHDAITEPVSGRHNGQPRNIRQGGPRAPRPGCHGDGRGVRLRVDGDGARAMAYVQIAAACMSVKV